MQLRITHMLDCRLTANDFFFTFLDTLWLQADITILQFQKQLKIAIFASKNNVCEMDDQTV